MQCFIGAAFARISCATAVQPITGWQHPQDFKGLSSFSLSRSLYLSLSACFSLVRGCCLFDTHTPSLALARLRLFSLACIRTLSLSLACACAFSLFLSFSLSLFLSLSLSLFRSLALDRSLALALSLSLPLSRSLPRSLPRILSLFLSLFLSLALSLCSLPRHSLSLSNTR